MQGLELFVEDETEALILELGDPVYARTSLEVVPYDGLVAAATPFPLPSDYDEFQFLYVVLKGFSGSANNQERIAQIPVVFIREIPTSSSDVWNDPNISLNMAVDADGVVTVSSTNQDLGFSYAVLLNGAIKEVGGGGGADLTEVDKRIRERIMAFQTGTFDPLSTEVQNNATSIETVTQAESTLRRSVAGLADVARTGEYSDLLNAPDIPEDFVLEAQPFNDMLAFATVDARVYSADLLESINTRDDLDGDYFTVLKSLNLLPSNVTDATNIQVRVQGSDLSTTLVHTENWTRVQGRRVFTFNISDAEKSGAGGKIQRHADGRIFYHFILVFRNGNNPLFSLDSARLWVQSGTIPLATKASVTSLQNTVANLPVAETTPKATNAHVDAVASTTGDLNNINQTARNALNDSNFMSPRKVARMLARVVRQATSSVVGVLRLATNAEYDTPGASDNAIAATPFGVRRLLSVETNARESEDARIDRNASAAATLANEANQAAVAAQETAETLGKRFTFDPPYFVRDNAATTNRNVIVHFDSIFLPSGTTHVGFNLQGVPALARLEVSTTETYSFLIGSTGVRNISRHQGNLAEGTLSFWGAASGGSQTGDQIRNSVRLVTVAPAGAADVQANLTQEIADRTAADTALGTRIDGVITTVNTKATYRGAYAAANTYVSGDIVMLTQAQYDAISSPVAGVLYLIQG